MICASRSSPLSTDKLVKFNAVLGNDISLPKQMRQSFPGVIAQIFPLKASLARLTEFCDTYLNFSDKDENLKQFSVARPAAPMVILQVNNYPKLSVGPGDVGWFAQREVAFGIPLIWQHRESKKDLYTVEWALTYPFIFVDTPISIASGREVYGWAKKGMRIESQLDDPQPNAPHTLYSVYLGTSSNFSGASRKDFRSRPFMEVAQSSPLLSGRATPAEFLKIPSRLAGSYITAALGILELIGLPPFGMPRQGFSGLLPVLHELWREARSGLPNLINLLGLNWLAATSHSSSFYPVPAKILTLKQFRDAFDTNAACYQALVQSSITIDGLIDGGPLFDLLLGDPTGGIHIDIRDDSSQSVVADLGLEVTEQFRSDNGQINRLRPICPVWAKVDISYQPADLQYWRSLVSTWSATYDPILLPDAFGAKELRFAPDPQHKESAKLTLRPENYSIDYVTQGSGAREEVGGTISSSNLTLRVLPLLVADGGKDKLQSLINDYMDNPSYSFKLADQYLTDPNSPW
jgi:hypothetical protein